MGLKTKYVLSNQEGLEQVYPDVYLKVLKINTANSDYEFFETVNDPDHPDIDQKLSWISRIESNATVYAWYDELARKNRVQPFHWFSFDFIYDLNSLDNIYQQAYSALHKLFPEGADVI